MGLFSTLWDKALVRHPHVTVADATFDTRTVRNDYDLIKYDFPPLWQGKIGRVDTTATLESLGHVQLPHDYATLCERGGLKRWKPTLHILEYSCPQALITCDIEQVGITKGALHLFARDEAAGVLGHELGHLCNHDVPPKRDRAGRRVLSRTYSEMEFAADKTAVELTHNPDAMMRALGKLRDFQTEMKEAARGFGAELMLKKAKTAFGGTYAHKGPLMERFHPPLLQRIDRIGAFAERVARGCYTVAKEGRWHIH